MPKIPTARLEAVAPPRDVVFDFGRLVAIEEATGRPLFDLLDEFLRAMPKGENPDQAELSSAAKRIRLGTIARFVAGCLDLELADLGTHVAPEQLLAAYFELWPAFAIAVVQLAGPKEGQAEEERGTPAEDEQGTRPSSGISGPGRSSNSA